MMASLSNIGRRLACLVSVIVIKDRDGCQLGLFSCVGRGGCAGLLPELGGVQAQAVCQMGGVCALYWSAQPGHHWVHLLVRQWLDSGQTVVRQWSDSLEVRQPNTDAGLARSLDLTASKDMRMRCSNLLQWWTRVLWAVAVK